MKNLSVGVLSKIPNLLNELRIRLPSEVSLSSLTIPTKNKEQQVDIIVADFDLLGPHLYALNNVKFVQGTWAGIDALMPHIRPDSKLNFPVLRFSGQHFGKIISEYVLACIVNHERDFWKVYGNQRKQAWSQEGKIHSYRTIYDLTVGVMGVGQIGSRLIETLKFMGANVQALGRRPNIDPKQVPYVDNYFPTSELSSFLTKCDYIVNTLPNTNETRGMLNNPALEACKEKSPVFINVGRGGVIADESLLHALENNYLSHAYLDVFNQEPLPDCHAFWSSGKVKITPHVAATSRAQDIADQFTENLKRFQQDEAFPTEIDFTRGY